MDLDRQALGLGGLEHGFHLIRREGDALAEDVDRVRQPLGGDGIEQRPGDERRVVARATLVFRRHGVRPEEGGADRHRPLAADAARDAQLLQLRLLLQPVSGLDLDGGDAFGHQCGEAPVGRGEERIFARLARRLDGGEDAAACPRDLLIGRALETELELMRPVAAIDEMGVAIDQPGGDPAAFAINGLSGLEGGRFAARPGIDDASVMGGDDAVLDRAIGRTDRCRHRRQPRIRPELVADKRLTRRIRHRASSRYSLNWSHDI